MRVPSEETTWSMMIPRIGSVSRGDGWTAAVQAFPCSTIRPAARRLWMSCQAAARRPMTASPASPCAHIRGGHAVPHLTGHSAAEVSHDFEEPQWAPHGGPYGPEVTRHPRTGGLSAVSRTSAVARVTCLATASPRRAAQIDLLGPRVRGGVGGEKDADRCVGEVVQLRCAEGPVIPAEHGLVQ